MIGFQIATRTRKVDAATVAKFREPAGREHQ